MEEEKFNFCIASTNKDNSIDLYSIYNPNFFGTKHNAIQTLEYIKEQSPNKNWKIFKIIELEENNELIATD